MAEKKYGWNGWKMPILHPNDPDFCEIGCPILHSAPTTRELGKFVVHRRWTLRPDSCMNAVGSLNSTIQPQRRQDDRVAGDRSL